MKNILAENLLRFGVKNLSESDKKTLSENILIEQTQEAKNALTALNEYLFKNPFKMPNYEGSIRGTALMVNKRDIEIADIKKKNPDAPIVSAYLRLRMLGVIDATTKNFTLTKVEMEANMTQATLDAYEKIAPGFIERAKTATTSPGFMYRVNVPVTAKDTVATVEANIKKNWAGVLGGTLLTNMLTLYGVKA